MKTPLERSERQVQLLALLHSANGPVPAGELATRFGVSRQVIVQDVAMLRAAGQHVLATARGYVTRLAARHETVVAVRHGPEQTRAELYALVDAGVRVLDVMVTHPLYGELRGTLFLSARADVDEWLTRARACRAHLLSELTDGQHFHTLESDRPECIERARDGLRALQVLAED